MALGLITIAASAQWSNPAADIPAYNAKPPAKPLPAILSGEQLTGHTSRIRIRSPPTRWRQRFPQCCTSNPATATATARMGHNSLHSCFEGTHGAACSTCMQEAVYAYQQTQKGKTPSQIRAGIERGDLAGRRSRKTLLSQAVARTTLESDSDILIP